MFPVMFANCIVVQGVKYAIICDLQRQKYFHIPFYVAEFINQFGTDSLGDLRSRFSNHIDFSIDECVSLLEEHDLMFYTHDPRLFPELSLEWDSPALITNGIIDISKDSPFLDFKDIFQQYSSLGAECIQLRFFTPKHVKNIYELMCLAGQTNIATIDLIMMYHESLLISNDVSRLLQSKNIGRVLVHGIPQEVKGDVDGLFMSKSGYYGILDEIDSKFHCGQVDVNLFVINVTSFTEASKFNSCLNRKISIDSNGNICNCPSMTNKYGSIMSDKLVDIARMEKFQELWNMSKDFVDICSVCEYRYICVDCRAYLDEPSNMNSKPLKCGYDPCTGKWEEWSKSKLKQAVFSLYKKGFSFFILIIFFSSCVVPKNKLEKYYDYINSAEIEIVSGKEIRAASLYRKADNIIPLEFSNLYNYALCSVKSGNYHGAMKPVNDLLSLGLSKSYFEKNQNFSSFIESDEWLKLKGEVPNKVFSNGVRQRVQELFNWDQEFRYAYRENYDTIKRIDSIIGLEVWAMLHEYGNISTRTVGVDMLNDSTFRRGASKFSALLIHQVKRHPVKYEIYLRELVLSGKMSPRAYAFQSSNFLKNDSTKLNCYQAVQGQLIQVGAELYICDDQEIEMIDKNRLKIYLETLAEQRMKFEYYYERDRSYLLGGHVFTFGEGMNVGEAAKIKKELKTEGFILYRTLKTDKSYTKLNLN